MNPIAMTLVLLTTVGALVYSLSRRVGILKAMSPEPEFSFEGDQMGKRIRNVMVYLFGQKRMPKNEKYRIAGIAHIAIFAAFMVLGLNSLMLWIRGYDADFNFFGLLARGFIVGDLYNLVKELSAAAAVVGSLVFVYYRVVVKSQRMTLGSEGLLILGIIITMMLSDFLYVGAGLARAAAEGGTQAHWEFWEPIGSALAVNLAGTDEGTLAVLEHAGFWWHATWVLLFANLLPYSKHFHIFTIWANVFATRTGHVGRLPNVENIEEKVENEEPIGLAKGTDLTWKQALDLYTCTECGRCSDNCPAYTTGKKLSPKHLTLALRDHLYASQGRLIAEANKPKPKQGEESEEAAEAEEIEPPEGGWPKLHTTPPAPDGYWTTGEPVELVPNIVDPDVIWACTSCRACEDQCPVMITYVDKIVQMRRDQVMIKNEFPPDLMKPFNGIETNGNPWNLPSMDRADWADGLEVPTIEDKPDAEVLYWVGCAASYDDRAKKVARSFAKLLKHAGVDFAILGTSESCTGDPARRAGNEYLFQIVAEQNVETLNEAGVDKKKVVTACPHCFNTLANEYPDFGGKYDVVHHTEFLMGLIEQGKLRPEKQVNETIAFHDSCYLGRYNNVYDAPRQILESIPGVKLKEVAYWNKSKGLCCGAGGAQMFMEEQESEGGRVNQKRTLQLLDTGADTLATGCPFCMTMITDGLKAENMEDDKGQKDVAEILAQSVALSSDKSAVAAE